MGFEALREKLVAGWRSAGAIRDERVLAAIQSVDRHTFVAADLVPRAYEDAPLPIGEGQTISQPYIVAVMAEVMELKGNEKVLEVGTGFGYAAAVLGRLAREVHTIERLPNLAEAAAQRLTAMGMSQVHVHVGDGSLGLASQAPYDAISVAASSPGIPPAMVSQLADGGRLVLPVGGPNDQRLVRIRREGKEWREETLQLVRFVPLIGEQGWA